MGTNYHDYLQSLSKYIENEEKRYFIETFAPIIRKDLERGDKAKDTTPDESDKIDILSHTDKKMIALLTLCSLRVHTYLSLQIAERKRYADAIKEDWERIIDSERHLSRHWDITDGVISNSFDLLLLVNPSNRFKIRKTIGYKYVSRIRAIKPLCEEMTLSACKMITYCMENHFKQEAAAIAKNFAALSRKRNASRPDLHKCVLIQMMKYLSEIDHDAANRLGEEHRRLL